LSVKSRVLIRAAEYDGSMDKAVEEAFDYFKVDVAGKKVLVKPNLLSARAPDKGVTTHPSVVAAVVKSLEKRRAGEIVVGDNSGMTGYGENERVAAKTGVLDAAGKYYRNLGQKPVKAKLHNPFAPEAAVSGEIFECDVLVSLPRMKTHSLTTITCAVKNSYGFLLGAEKARLHRAAKSGAAFAKTVVDVWALRRPDLVICDAVTAMQGNGPSSRDIIHYGYILASADSVALDSVASRIMGLDPAEVLTTVEAAGRGLGKMLPADIEIDGPFLPIEGFKLPSSFARGGIVSFLARFAGSLVVSYPRPDTNVCLRCGLCIDHCPVQAVTLSPYPSVDHGKCIRCYCCLEFCPHDAMKLATRVRFFRALAGARRR
jgi:uncharacterized protein (DUF362 family)/NAD-dependent dihydropyrimidine dehydrogenase PreA subunit